MFTNSARRIWPALSVSLNRSWSQTSCCTIHTESCPDAESCVLRARSCRPTLCYRTRRWCCPSAPRSGHSSPIESGTTSGTGRKRTARYIRLCVLPWFVSQTSTQGQAESGNSLQTLSGVNFLSESSHFLIFAGQNTAESNSVLPLAGHIIQEV